MKNCYSEKRLSGPEQHKVNLEHLELLGKKKSNTPSPRSFINDNIENVSDPFSSFSVNVGPNLAKKFKLESV